MKTAARALFAIFVAQITLGAAAAVDQQQRVDLLIDAFENTRVFWRQHEIAEQIVKIGNASAKQRLEPWLKEEDRHLRGNAAFIFAGLGDSRGFEALRLMLFDRSARPEGQGIPGAGFSVARQVEADRYYAVHLLGELREARAVEPLIALLDDGEVNYKAAWALGEIGDRRAVAPLMEALGHRDALVRVSAIRALVELGATEALPKIRELLTDDAMPRAGDRVSVGQAAKAAIETLRKAP